MTGRRPWMDYFGESDGELTISGLKVSQLEKRFGTPLYVYDLSVVEKKYRMVKEALEGFDIFYSIKANPNLHIMKLLSSLGAGMEVASTGELFLAKKIGVSPSNIIFAGPGKTDTELREAVVSGIYAVNVESLGELKRLELIADELQRDVGVALRINTRETAESAPEKMVGGSSKFGFDEETVVSELRSVALNRCRILGIHVYTGSGVLDVEELLAAFKRILRLACALSQELKFPLRFIDFGGGFGVPYSEGEEPLDLLAYAEGVKSALDEVSGEFDLSDTRLAFELGRYLVAESGVYLTKVIDVKESRGSTYVITDGGMNQLIRPVFMKTDHPTVVATALDSKGRPATIAGPLCTPIDVIASEVEIGTADVGDLIAVFNAGAYGYSMSMLYFLSHPLPAEVVIDKGTPILARRRGGVEDALIHQVNY
ncbi:MAG: diaminopimelate decarboxylase [Bacillota bacterium]